VTVVNRLGLHARPAMEFVDLASSYPCSVTVRRAEEGAEELDGKSIMQMMMLAATKGTVLEISCDGDEATTAADGLVKLIESGFNED
jgi:phosphocarrier protein